MQCAGSQGKMSSVWPSRIAALIPADSHLYLCIQHGFGSVSPEPRASYTLYLSAFNSSTAGTKAIKQDLSLKLSLSEGCCLHVEFLQSQLSWTFELSEPSGIIRDVSTISVGAL